MLKVMLMHADEQDKPAVVSAQGSPSSTKGIAREGRNEPHNGATKNGVPVESHELEKCCAVMGCRFKGYKGYDRDP